MLRHERAALVALARQPALLVGGFAVAVAWLLAQVAVGVPLTLVTVPQNTRPVFALPLAGLVSAVVLPTPLAGLYAVVRTARAGDTDAAELLSAFAGGVSDHARDLTAATLWFRLAALVPASAAFVVLLAGDTGLNYLWYVGGVSGHQPATLEIVVVGSCVAAAGAVGRLTLAFYDLPVLFGDAAPRRGWRVAARVTGRRPRTVVRYGAGRLLLWSPTLAAWTLGSLLLLGEPPAEDPATLAGLAAAGVLVVALTSAATAAHHVVVYERAVEPELGAPAGAGDGTANGVESSPDAGGAGTLPDRSVLLAGVAVLLVVAAGTGAVRVTDTRPTPPDAEPVGPDVEAGAAVESAEQRLEGTSFRSVSRTYEVNGTTGERSLLIGIRIGVDRRARRAVVSSRLRVDEDDWQRTTIYASETTTAFGGSGNRNGNRLTEGAGVSPFVGGGGDEWSVLLVPGYGLADGAGNEGTLDARGHDWQVLDRDGEHLVVGYTDRPRGEPPDDGSRMASRRVRVRIDRATGRPTRIVENRTFLEYDNGTVVERRWSVTEVTFEYEDVSVSRPDGLGARGPLEWVWDLVYY